MGRRLAEHDGPHRPGHHPVRWVAGDPISPQALGRTAGIILTLGALSGLPASIVLVSPEQRVASFVLTVSASVFGVFCWFAPWGRWPPGRTVIIPIVSLALLSAGLVQAKRADAYAAFFVVIFAWTGMTQSRWTCFKLIPLGVFAYAVPELLRGSGWGQAALAMYYIPVAALTGEVVSWLAERVRESERRMRSLGELKDDFLAMVAHDMRTPVVIISGFTDELRARGDELTPAQRDQALDAIGRNARRASEFVENLLQFARIEADEFTHDAEAFDVRSLVERVVHEYVSTDKDHLVRSEVPDRLPLAFGDEVRTHQVLGNLLSNAIKYSPIGAPILVEVREDGDELVVGVHDQGRGVPPDEIGKLFQKFSQIHRSDDVKRAVSTGLGLYICRGIVERQGGRIWFEDHPGAGASFLFTVPKADRLAPSKLDGIRVAQPDDARSV